MYSADENILLLLKEKNYSFNGEIVLQLTRTTAFRADGSPDVGHRFANSYGEYYYNDTLSGKSSLYDINGNEIVLPEYAHYITANTMKSNYVKPNEIGNHFSGNYVTMLCDDSHTILVRGVGAIKLKPVAPEPSDWARDSIEFMSALGIMQGKTGNMFTPHDTYTVEQAAITVLRLINLSK